MLSSLGGIGLALAIVGLIVGDVQLLFPGSGSLVSQEVLLLAAIVCVVPWLITRTGGPLKTWPFLGVFWTLILSDWFARGFTLFQGPGFRGELLAMGLLAMFILAKKVRLNFVPVFLVSVVLVVGEFLRASGGVPLLMDDNGVFYFRLELLKRFFPNIPLYYTAWDAGLDARDFFATGALNLYFLYWPLIELFPLKSTFNLIVCGVLVVVPTLSLFCACRLLGYSKRAAAISGLIGFATSLQWFKWGLKFGTLGFLTTAGLLPLMVVLYVIAVSKERELSKLQAVSLVLISTLIFLWPLGCVIAAPLGVLLLLFYKRIAAKRYVIACLVGLFVLNAPWALVFAKVSKVGSFVSGKDSVHSAVDFVAPSSERASGAIDRTFQTIHDNFVGANPLIIAFAIPGLALLGGFERRVLISIAVWLLGLGVFVSPLKPQLELGRFILVALFIGAIPTAKFIEALLESKPRLKAAKLSIAAVLGMVLLTPFAATNAIRSRTMEKFQFSDETLRAVSGLIEQFGGEGRTLFSGFVLHEFDGGHAAPLTLMTSKPLMASSFAHNQWSYKQVFPEEFLKDKAAGIEEFLNLYNVTLVLAHEERWIKFFTDASAKFQRVGVAGPFTAFRRINYKPSYILSGEADISATESSVVVALKSNEVAIKYRYYPFLKAEGCKLAPYVVQGLAFIMISDCSKAATTISSKGAFQRVLE